MNYYYREAQACATYASQHNTWIADLQSANIPPRDKDVTIQLLRENRDYFWREAFYHAQRSSEVAP